MTNERPEENSNAIDGAGEEAEFHQASAGKSLQVGLFCNLTKVENKISKGFQEMRLSLKGFLIFIKIE